MRARTMLASLLLGASLLGAYLALAQESPRPRPVAPPDVGGVDLPVIIEGTIERERPNSDKKKSLERALTPLSEAAEPPPPQRVEAPGMLPNLLPVIQAGGTPPTDLLPPPPIAPPVAPDQSSPPPPSPAAPPSNIPAPDLPKLPRVADVPETVPAPLPEVMPVPRPEKSAPVTPWAPKEKFEERHPSVPAVPVSRPVEPPMPPEAPSRFVVPRSSAKRPIEEPAPVQAGTESLRPIRPETPPIPRFDQVKIFRTPAAQTVTGTPTGFERFPATTALAPSAEIVSASTVTPQLTIEKRGPFYQKAGTTLAYQIVLKNIGSTTAVGVRIEDEIPGMTRRNIQPEPVYAQSDRLAWVVPTLRPGEEKTFLLELVPNRAGDLVSTTSVVITQSTSFRTKQEDDGNGSRTKTPTPDNFDLPPPTPSPLPLPGPHTGGPTPLPALDADMPLPGPAVIKSPILPSSTPLTVEVKPIGVAAVGQKIVLEIVIANPGSSPLSQLMLIGTLPPGLKHPAGDSIGADLPDLAPGETKTFKMPVTAAQVGTHTVEIRVKTKDSEIVSRPQVEVIAPIPGSTSNAAPATIQQTSASGLQLQIQSRDAQIGLGRETIAVVSLANMGVAPASNVQLTLFLSDGLEATQNAQAPVRYRINGKRIFFESVSGMQPDGKLLFHVGVRAVGVGEQNIRVQVTSDQERAPVARDLRLSVAR